MQEIATRDPRFVIVRAIPDDAGLVLGFMRKLGRYQKMADQITATEPRLRRLLSERQGEAVFGLYDRVPVAFAYFSQTSSAFTGRSGLFIDGFLVDEDFRGSGLGRIMMEFLSREALDRQCEMLEWGCLDWNAPAIRFYEGLGAYCLDTMRVYRLAPDDLRSLADRA
ncbi:GNAT family N-acetyltransferase [Tabrizicola sp.]|uniref:GNAT family N-acetyltransferase n=1 Tax=Tabrizicola sp. TaxID=2005166 RepID=UPI00286A4D1E|nr:GNAT family N-acetyltransferase [Tabrizicola sp.]